jgi:putative chitinase
MELHQFADAANISLQLAQSLYEGVSSAVNMADLSTPQRLAAFIAQCGHESDGFKYFEENLNYRAESLVRVWPSHFNSNNASEYAHNPEKIANRAYCFRMGNGPEDSGDGWNYRGRGFLQLTGRSNYEQASSDLEIDFLSNPDAVATPEGACVTAAWFWKKHNLNNYVDQDNFVGLTKAINGGTLGLENRQQRYEHALNVLLTS